MGTRSDAGVAIKKEHLPALMAKCDDFLGQADEKIEMGEGTLFVFRDIRWHPDFDDDVTALYAALKKLPPDAYRVVEACYDFPESDENDKGEWLNNPFGLGKNISVSLDFSR